MSETAVSAEGVVPTAIVDEGLGNSCHLARTARDLPAEPTVLMCGHGERAMGAASLLERAGHRDLAVLAGGPHDWAQASGKRLQVGP